MSLVARGPFRHPRAASGRVDSAGPARQLRTQWLWLAYAVVSLSLSLAALETHAAIPNAVLHDLVVVSAGLVAFAGIRINRPRPRLPWVLFALGTLSFGAGDIAYNLDQVRGQIPTLSVGDGLYGFGGLLLLVALAILGSSGAGSAKAARMLYVDTATILVGGAVLVWFLVVGPQFHDGGVPTATHVLGVIYPALDLVMLAVTARIALTHAFRLPAYRLLTAAVMFGFAGDLIWRGFPASDLTTWITASYYVCYALLGAAALHPTMRDLRPLAATEETSISRRRIGIMGTAALCLPAAVLSAHHDGWRTEDLVILAAATGVVPLLMMYRLADLVGVSNELSDRARRASARVEALIDASPLPIAVLSPHGVVELWNEAAEAVSGWLGLQVIGGPAPIFPAEGEERVDDLRRRALAGERLDGVEARLQNHAGEPRTVRVWTSPVHGDGELDAVIAIFADVTKERRREREIRYLADHDPLTGLFNRRWFNERLRTLIQEAGATVPALAIVDVDDFKLINDTYGHAIGDDVLVRLSKALESSLGEGDSLARLSGDEFALLLRGREAGEIEADVQRLLEIARDLRLGTHEGIVDLTISVGLCNLVPGLSVKQALAHADAALYESKRQGRNRLVTWGPTYPEQAARSAARRWSVKIKDALRDGRLLMYLQPIVELRSRDVVGYEALARLCEPSGAIIEPPAFIPYAERLGLMPAIDHAIIEQAFAWLEENRQLKLFVNLDASSFEDTRLLTMFEERLAGSPTLRDRIGVEITEHTSLRDVERARIRLERLHELGCTISLDDFGTGFSSFSLLRELPVDIVKIGNGFVREIGEGPRAGALVQAIVAGARALGSEVVAEDVESDEVATALASFGVRFAQGYLFGRPAPPRHVVHSAVTPTAWSDGPLLHLAAERRRMRAGL